MVKIKGYRVELEEVTSALSKCPGVNEAVVVALDNMLVAFVSPTSIDIDDLRVSVSSSLPHYMCPSRFYKLDGLPLNSNQKVDKKQLISLYTSLKESFSSKSGTRLSTTEMEVRDVWASVLGYDVGLIDADTSFFDIGGDSMNSLLLLSKMEKMTSAKLSLTSLYKYQSLRALSAYIEGDDVHVETKLIDWDSEVEECQDLVVSGIGKSWPMLKCASLDGPIVLTGATGFLGAQVLRDLVCYCIHNALTFKVGIYQEQGDLLGGTIR